MIFSTRRSTPSLGEFNSVQDTNVNTGFVDNNGNIANENIFRDCYIEANGAIKYHKITDDTDDDFSEEEVDEEELIGNFAASDKDILNVKKNNFKQHLYKDSLGMGDCISSGVAKFVCEDAVGKPLNNKGRMRFNKEKLYDELNSFLHKNYTIDSKKLNEKVNVVSNFSDVLLDLDLIEGMADDLLADEDTKFQSKEERKAVDALIKKAFNKDLFEDDHGNFDYEAFTFYKLVNPEHPKDQLFEIMHRNCIHKDFRYELKLPMINEKTGKEVGVKYNRWIFDNLTEPQKRFWDHTCNDPRFINENKLALLRQAEIFELLEKLNNLVVVRGQWY